MTLRYFADETLYLALYHDVLGPNGGFKESNMEDLGARLAKRREILIFPRTAGNTGNSREILVIPGNYWEICPSSIKKF